MPSRFFPRTRPWPGGPGRNERVRARRERRGSTALIAVFIFFLFSALGLGTIFLTQTYLRLSAFKKNSLILDYTAENGVKRAFARVLEAFRAAPRPAALAGNECEALRVDASNGGRGAAEKAMGIVFPFFSEETAGEQRWSGAARCVLDRFRDAQTHFLADYRISIEAEGRFGSLASSRTSALDVGMKAVAGRIPLAYFTFLLAGVSGNGPVAELVAEKKLELLPSRQKDLAPRALVTPRPLLPADPGTILAQAAKVKFLRPNVLDRAELRRALGLGMVDEAIPDGVYIIRNDAGPGGIFVQGDLDRLLLGVEGGWQYMRFEAGDGAWTLKFSPAASRTEFDGGEEPFASEKSMLGMVLVNGTIGTLAAAEVQPDGGLAPVPDEEIPCVLDGLPLTIVSADEITIGSDLLHEGVRWMSGVPYLKEKQSQLIVYAGGRDLIDGTERLGRINIGAGAPDEINIQASLTAAETLVAKGGLKSITVSGGVQAAGLDLGESKLRLAADERITGDAIAPGPGPLTSEPVLLVLSLIPRAWTERK